jgi:CBS domain-containing protein
MRDQPGQTDVSKTTVVTGMNDAPYGSDDRQFVLPSARHYSGRCALETERNNEMEGQRVRDLMKREVTTLQRNEKLTAADDIMRLGRIRHLPVLDEDGQLAGIVSQRDLFRGALARALGYGEYAQRKLLDGLLVKEVMTSEVITADPNMPLPEAARVLVQRKIGCLPVVEDGRLVGILTESDFVGMVAKQ